MAKNFYSYELIKEITDRDSFVETLSLIKGKSSLGLASGEGVVSGYATINDIQVGVFSLMKEVLDGSLGKKGAKKISQLIKNSVKIGMPVIGFLDSKGARFAEGIKALEGYGTIIDEFNKAYGKIPLILVVTGQCYGMLSFLLKRADCVIALEEASINSSSPLILASKSGKNVEEVGTVKIHSQKTGLITNVVKSTEELKSLVYSLVDIFSERHRDATDDANRTSPKLKISSTAFDIISEVFDDKKFIELNRDFGKESIIGFCRLNGYSVGVVANNGSQNEGRISADSSYKTTRFLNTCNSFNIPVINIIDCKGAVIDLQNENGYLLGNVSDMLYSYVNLKTCKIALVTRNAIGLGYVAFASKRTTDYTIAWEKACIGMLDDESTASLLFSDIIASAENKEVLTKELAESYGKDNSESAIVAEEGYIDNVISPSLTRQYLIASLHTFINKRREDA